MIRNMVLIDREEIKYSLSYSPAIGNSFGFKFMSIHSPRLASHLSANEKHITVPGPGAFPCSSWKTLSFLTSCGPSKLHLTATSLVLPSHLTPLPHFDCFNAEVPIITRNYNSHLFITILPTFFLFYLVYHYTLKAYKSVAYKRCSIIVE